MTPKIFKRITKQTTNDLINPLAGQLEEVKKKVAEIEKLLNSHRKFARRCQELINGETSTGFLGMTSDYAMFVSQYSVEPPNKERNWHRLNEANLVIIPEVLEPHLLRVNIPTSKPGVSTNTSRTVNVTGIVTRMLKHCENATNVVVGTFADVKREPCNNCGKEALVVGFELYDDEDERDSFIVSQLCEHCSSISDIAAAYCSSHIYRHQ